MSDAEQYKKTTWLLLQRELKPVDVSMLEVDRRLDKPRGWTANRARYAFDIGDLITVLLAAQISPEDFFSKVCEEICDTDTLIGALLEKFDGLPKSTVS